METNYNVAPFADLATMLPRQMTHLHRFALQRQTWAYEDRNRAAAQWWGSVWSSVEVAIEGRMS